MFFEIGKNPVKAVRDVSLDLAQCEILKRSFQGKG